MSALPPKADMDQSGCDVRFVPKADIGVVGKLTATASRALWYLRCARGVRHLTDD
jgi:hypothetical protein